MTAVLLIMAAHPLWSQSAVWQPQGATTGNIYYNGGNVGIGTASPAEKLHVYKPSGYTEFIIDNGAGTFDTGLRIRDASRAWKLGINVAGQGPGKFMLWDISVGPRLTIDTGGNVGIGTTNPQYKLAVNGNIGAKDIIVTSTGWSDYIFRPGYRLSPLSEVSAFIQKHQHLPDIPSEAEVREKGVSVGEMQAKLLAKIEELTLHLIQQEQRVAELERQAERGATGAGR